MIHSEPAPSDDPDRTFLNSLQWIAPHVIDAILADLVHDSLPGELRLRQGWLLYTAMQFIAGKQRRYRIERPLEERLDAFLEALEADELPDDWQEVGTWLRYLPGNRAKKHNRQDRLLKRFSHDLRRSEPVSPPAAAEQTDEIDFVRSHVSDREWDLLNRVSVAKIKVVALSVRLGIGTLKSIISRCRARLRRAS